MRMDTSIKNDANVYYTDLNGFQVNMSTITLFCCLLLQMLLFFSFVFVLSLFLSLSLMHAHIPLYMYILLCVHHSSIHHVQMQRRQYLSKLPLQGNFYPLPSMAFFESKQHRLSVLSAQPLGCASLSPGMCSCVNVLCGVHSRQMCGACATYHGYC